jgi:hypothetical protein
LALSLAFAIAVSSFQWRGSLLALAHVASLSRAASLLLIDGNVSGVLCRFATAAAGTERVDETVLPTRQAALSLVGRELQVQSVANYGKGVPLEAYTPAVYDRHVCSHAKHHKSMSALSSNRTC